MNAGNKVDSISRPLNVFPTTDTWSERLNKDKNVVLPYKRTQDGTGG